MALKKCTECRSVVSTRAVSCPKCGAVVKRKTGCLGWALLVIIGFIALAVMSAQVGDRTSRGRQGAASSATQSSAKTKSLSPPAASEITDGRAYVDAKEHIATILASPETAKFPWVCDVKRVGERGRKVTSYVDSQNVFGATMRTHWTVYLLYDENDGYQIRDVVIHKRPPQ